MRDFHEFLTDTSESNARKRAVLAALRGTGPDLPGSMAACPSTNPVAMDVADKEGVVTKWEKHKKKKGKKKDKGDADEKSESFRN